MTKPSSDLLSTKELSTATGLSASYFEKGRIYGYGPKFIRLKANGKPARSSIVAKRLMDVAGSP